MIIKDYSKKKKIGINIFLKLYFLVSVLIIISFFAIFFNTGIWINNKDKFLNKIYFNGLNHYLDIPEIAYSGLKGFFLSHKEINIDLPYENLIIIEKNRKEILETSENSYRSDSQEFDQVEGVISYKDQSAKVRLRLKGDRISHFEDKEKVSYKLEIIGENKVKGVRKFSFIKPRARNYIHEWLFHEIAEDGNLIKLKYEFVKLKINGESQGLYVFEEGFDKDLIERNKRRNGPIFSMYEEFDSNIFNSKFELYNKNFWNREENINQASFARNKLQGFIKQKFKLEEVFDQEKWAFLFALADLTQTHHGLAPDNVKFYYNPISGLFEPIPYDGHRFAKNFHPNLKDYDNRNTFEIAEICKFKNKVSCKGNEEIKSKWLGSFFFNSDGELNGEFYLHYLKAIRKITSDKYLNTFFEKRKKSISEINSAIYSDYFLLDNVTYGKYGPGLYYFSKDDLYIRAKVLNNKVKVKLNKISAIQTTNQIVVENNDLKSNISLRLKEIICEKIENNWRKNFIYNISSNQNLNNKIKISRNQEDLLKTNCTHIKLEDKSNGQVFTKKINFNNDLFFSEKKISDRYKKYFSQSQDTLYLKESKILISEDIIIPKDFLVKIKPGEEIIILNNSFIISDSPWVVGDEGKKVFIGGTIDNFGGGLVIKNSERDSKFYNTNFKYLSGVENRYLSDTNNKKSLILTKYSDAKKNDYIYEKKNTDNNHYTLTDKFSYTGAINFYKTKVVLNDCLFSKIDSEDAVNLISSEFLIDKLNFDENSSDAIDVDFGNGTIINSNFYNIGNDAIDLSGSKASLENLFFSKVGDKLISAGENSSVEIFKVVGEESYVGIASKDGSESIVKNITLNQVKIPFASYRKKKSYDYGTLKIYDPINLVNYVSKNVKDENSSIYINDIKVRNFNKHAFNAVYKKKLDLVYEQ